MQNIDLICLGKLNAAYCAAGVAEYQKRLSAFCNFRIIELPEALTRANNALELALEAVADAFRATGFTPAPALTVQAQERNAVSRAMEF